MIDLYDVNLNASIDDDHNEQVVNVPRPPRFFPRPAYLDLLTDAEFRNRFRLHRDDFLRLHDILFLRLMPQSARQNSVTVTDQLLITLRFYATGNFQTTNGDLFGRHQSTVSRIVRRVTNVICSGLKREFISIPNGQREMNQLKEGFRNIVNPAIPDVWGAIDCTHVKITSPGGPDAELYRNRKSYFSINVQTVSSADLQVLDVEARWYGSAHDSNIYDNSSLKARILNGEIHGFLLGDAGYTCTTNLLTPLTRANTRAEERYQDTHILMRNTVERQYGVMKRRWPCLALGMQIRVSTVLRVIVGCCILHNYAIRCNDTADDFPEITDDQPQPVLLNRVGTILKYTKCFKKL